MLENSLGIPCRLVNIFEKPQYLVVVLIASQIPDIDLRSINIDRYRIRLGYNNLTYKEVIIFYETLALELPSSIYQNEIPLKKSYTAQGMTFEILNTHSESKFKWLIRKGYWDTLQEIETDEPKLELSALRDDIKSMKDINISCEIKNINFNWSTLNTERQYINPNKIFEKNRGATSGCGNESSYSFHNQGALNTVYEYTDYQYIKTRTSTFFPAYASEKLTFRPGSMFINEIKEPGWPTDFSRRNYLYVYDGPSTSSPLIHTYRDTKEQPGDLACQGPWVTDIQQCWEEERRFREEQYVRNMTKVITSTHPTGALTFVFAKNDPNFRPYVTGSFDCLTAPIEDLPKKYIDEDETTIVDCDFSLVNNESTPYNAVVYKRFQASPGKSFEVIIKAADLSDTYVYVYQADNDDSYENPYLSLDGSNLSSDMTTGVLPYSGEIEVEYESYSAENKLEIQFICHDAPTPSGGQAGARREIDEKHLNRSNTISISPNPASDYLNINIGNIEGKKIIRIVSISGEVIQEVETSKYDHKLDISNLSKGMYILTVSSTEFESVRKRFFKK